MISLSPQSSQMSHVSSFRRLSMAMRSKTEAKYRLAQKLFQSRKFQQSLDVSKQVYEEALTSFRTDSQREKTLVKAACLHMVIAGVLAKEGNVSYDSVSPELKSDFIIIDLQATYGSSPMIPLQIWYHYFLALAGNKALQEGTSYFELLESLVTTLEDPGANDVHYSKLLELFVFEVLPSNECYSKARNIIQSHRQYRDNIEASTSRLADVKAHKEQIQKNETDAKRQEAFKEKKSLTVKVSSKLPSKKIQSGIRVLEQASEFPDTVSCQKPVKSTPLKRFHHVIHLIKSYMGRNGLWAIPLVIMALISRRIFKKGNLKIKRMLAETLKMAFQISYI